MLMSEHISFSVQEAWRVNARSRSADAGEVSVVYSDRLLSSAEEYLFGRLNEGTLQ